MINLSKELIRQIIADGGFQTPKDIGDYLKDIIQEMDIVKKLLNHSLEI